MSPALRVVCRWYRQYGGVVHGLLVAAKHMMRALEVHGAVLGWVGEKQKGIPGLVQVER